MVMQNIKCSKCGKSSNVSIGNRVYCTSCGAVISEKAAVETSSTALNPPSLPADPVAVSTSSLPQTTAPASTAVPTLTDIAIRPTSVTPPAPTSPAVTLPPATIAATPRLTDIAAPRPATQYHAQPVTNASAVSTPSVAAAQEKTPSTPAANPDDGPLLPITAHTSAPLPDPVADPASASVKPDASIPIATSIITPAATPMTPPAPVISRAPIQSVDMLNDRLAAAKQVQRSEQIVKFHPASDPLPLAAPPQGTSAPAPVITDAPPIANELPPPAVTQHQALANLIPATDPRLDEALAHAKSSATPKRPHTVATVAAALIVVGMGGYIWVQNYPHLQLSAVASKAGFTASLPGYLPSSYGLHGPISYQTGEVTLHYDAPGQPELTITQQLTSWDSQSLRDNFVAQQPDGYTSVQSQGLTIYLYGKDDATWVNDGVQYSITGASNLSRNQIVEIADNL